MAVDEGQFILNSIRLETHEINSLLCADSVDMTEYSDDEIDLKRFFERDRLDVTPLLHCVSISLEFAQPGTQRTFGS